MTENLTQPGNPRYTAHASPAADEPPRNQTSEESGMQKDRHDTQSMTALLCKETSVAVLKTNSLRCEAAGIIASSNSTTEALIPHEKLREAATHNATLIAQNRPLAQPAEESKRFSAKVIQYHFTRRFTSEPRLLKIIRVLLLLSIIRPFNVRAVVNQKIINSLAPLQPQNTKLMSRQLLETYLTEKPATLLQSALKSIGDPDLWMVVGVNRIGRVKDCTDMYCYGDDLLSQLRVGKPDLTSFLISLVNQNTDAAGDGSNRPDRLNPGCCFSLLDLPVIERAHKAPKQGHEYDCKPKHPHRASNHSSRKLKIFHTQLRATSFSASLKISMAKIYGGLA
jgi:hypothetical protein